MEERVCDECGQEFGIEIDPVFPNTEISCPTCGGPTEVQDRDE